MEISQVVKISKGGKEARLKEEAGGGGTKGVPLQSPGGHLQIPRCCETFPWASRKRGWEPNPTRNYRPDTRPEPESEFSAHQR